MILRRRVRNRCLTQSHREKLREKQKGVLCPLEVPPCLRVMVFSTPVEAPPARRYIAPLVGR